MPATKNALTRYIILDELLNDSYHEYDLNDLTRIVGDRLTEFYNQNGISRRMIEKDIKYLESESPFQAEIERYTGYAFNYEKQRDVVKHCLRYKEPGFSIFKKEMTDDEKYLLREALTILGTFDGLPDFSGLENLQKGLDVNTGSSEIISFTKNPLADSPLLGELFAAISHQQVLELHYHTFRDFDTDRKVEFCPYLLKEYNRRWFVFGAALSDRKILNFNLDCIDRIVPCPSAEFIPFKGDSSEWFEDIIGVTLSLESPIYQIDFWVSDSSKYYVMTKPLHESQCHIKGDHEQVMREKYPMLLNGAFFRIDCRDNYELIRELSSFGSDLIVLSPSVIKRKVIDRIEKMTDIYDRLPDE